MKYICLWSGEDQYVPRFSIGSWIWKTSELSPIYRLWDLKKCQALSSYIGSGICKNYELSSSFKRRLLAKNRAFEVCSLGLGEITNSLLAFFRTILLRKAEDFLDQKLKFWLYVVHSAYRAQYCGHWYSSELTYFWSWLGHHFSTKINFGNQDGKKVQLWKYYVTFIYILCVMAHDHEDVYFDARRLLWFSTIAQNN